MPPVDHRTRIRQMREPELQPHDGDPHFHAKRQPPCDKHQNTQEGDEGPGRVR